MKSSLFFFISLGLFFLMAPLASPVFPEDTESPEEAVEGGIEMNSLHAIPTYVQKKIYIKPWQQKKLDFPVRYACIGDVDGDKLNELISTDGEKLKITQWEYGQFRNLQDPKGKEKKRSFYFWPWPKHRTSPPLKEINVLNRGMKYIRLSSQDLDEDGQDEILFVVTRDKKLFSGVLSYEKQKFVQHLTDPGLFLKVFQGDNGRPLLLGQILQSPDKRTYRYDWDGISLQRGNPISLPDETPLFSLSSYRTDDLSDPAYVSLTNPGELRFFSSEFKEIAKMDSLNDPTQHTIRIQLDSVEGKSVKKKFHIPRRFLTGDFDRDGQDDLLLILTRPMLNVWGVRTLSSRNMVAGMVLTNGQIREFWDTKPIFGNILDQSVGDLDNNGRDDLVLITKDFNPFKKGTRLLIYELR
jgi:hypothetical protein